MRPSDRKGSNGMTGQGTTRSAAARDLIDRIVRADESLDAAAFVEVLAPDAAFRFAGGPAIVGREAVRAMVEGLFARLATLKHTILTSWEGEDTLVYEGEVHYTFHDGGSLTLPYANVLRTGPAGVHDYRIYLDPTPMQAR
jgi:uncharacterized protein (TIGR02246 family)